LFHEHESKIAIWERFINADGSINDTRAYAQMITDEHKRKAKLGKASKRDAKKLAKRHTPRAGN
jgi:hypothetical protein